MTTQREKIKVIDNISNLIQGIKSIKHKNDLAYIIHCIIDTGKIDYNLIACYKKDLFCNCPNKTTQ